MNLLSILTSCLVTLVVNVVGYDCNVNVANHNYDLNQAHQTNDYAGHDLLFTYNLNFCGPSSENACRLKDGVLCQYQSDDSGTKLTALLASNAEPGPTFALMDPAKPKSGLKATFTNGDVCYLHDEQVTRTVVINLICATANDPTFTIIEDAISCSFSLNLKTKAGCGDHSTPGAEDGLSGGTIFLIVLLCVFVVYILLGCVWNKRKGLTGRDLCPHREQWVNLCSLSKEGCVFALTKLKGGCRRKENYDEL